MSIVPEVDAQVDEDGAGVAVQRSTSPSPSAG